MFGLYWKRFIILNETGGWGPGQRLGQLIGKPIGVEDRYQLRDMEIEIDKMSAEELRKVIKRMTAAHAFEIQGLIASLAEAKGEKGHLVRKSAVVSVKGGGCTTVDNREDKNESRSPSASSRRLPSNESDSLGRDEKVRRMSLDVGENFFDHSGKLLPGFLKVKQINEEIAPEDLAVLAQSFLDAVKMSSGDTRTDIERWFDANFPASEKSEGEMDITMLNIKTFLMEESVKLRPMVKMFRLSLGARLFIVGASSYIDMLMDVLVTIALFKRAGHKGWGYASLGCITTAMGFQAFFAFLQYRGLGFR